MDEIQERWLQAWYFAAQAHAGQKVPGTELPYLIHLGAVGMEVLAAHQSSPFARPGLAVQCALLHDTLEDTDVDEKALLAHFDPAVVAGVRALTKDASLPKAEAMDDSLRRIREQPVEVWAVKLADRITNLGPPPPHWRADKVEAYRDEAARILASLGAAHATLAERLSRKIADYPPPSY
ncbi:HD domain-containing protein [Pendulispora rubella]|uniref:HD domain-containing protein n=1 Tax=Pendulispora rubella TaxID=2741070 RepID=A0ABZ2KSU0_9BACT